MSVKQKQPTHGRFKAFLSRVWVFLRLNPFRGFLGRVGALQLFESVALLLRQVFFVTTAKHTQDKNALKRPRVGYFYFLDPDTGSQAARSGRLTRPRGPGRPKNA